MQKMEHCMKIVRDFLVNATDWQSGYLAGVLITILLFILVFILVRILFHKRGVAGIVQHAANGDIFISARSISDLVKSLGASFPELTVNRVFLKKGKNHSFVLIISVDFRASEPQNSAKETLEKFQERSLESLNSVFGIDSVSSIRIDIRRTVYPEQEN